MSLTRTNFDIYASNKGGKIELFELPMLISACGIQVSDADLNQINGFLRSRSATSIDLQALVAAIAYLKGLESARETEMDNEEYLDAFVFLGG